MSQGQSSPVGQNTDRKQEDSMRCRDVDLLFLLCPYPDLAFFKQFKSCYIIFVSLFMKIFLEQFT